MYNRPVHILTFFDFDMASQVLEAEFHTDDKTNKKFLFG